MAKKKTQTLRRRTPHPRWGATKKQGERNAETRALKNRIFELENENKRLAGLMQSGITKNREDDRGIDDLFAKLVNVHLERMDKRTFWMGIYDITGGVQHIDFFVEGNGKILKAKVRK